MEIIASTDIPELQRAEGDLTHDVYDLDEDTQLVVHKDRIAVCGYPMRTIVPYKGVFINQVSMFWLNKFGHMTRSPILAHQPAKYPDVLQPYASMLTARSAIVKKIRPLPMTFTVRGYISGPEWAEFKETGLVSGYSLKRGTKEAQRIDQPLLIAASNKEGSQIEVEPKQWGMRMLGQKVYTAVEEICLSIYGVGRNHSAARGLILADTTFEFGLCDGDLHLISDVLSPDNSTYWPGGAAYTPGRPQPSFDKQAMYDWLDDEEWDYDSPPPALPSDVAKSTAKKYRSIFDVMTGKVAPAKKEEVLERA